MAIKFTVIEYEVGDKVVAGSDVDSKRNEFYVEQGEVFTIESFTNDPWTPEAWDTPDKTIYLTFEEVEGEYDEEDFYLHSSTIVRDIDPS